MPISEVTFDEGYLLFTDSDGVATKVLPIEEVKRLVIIADPDEGRLSLRVWTTNKDNTNRIAVPIVSFPIEEAEFLASLFTYYAEHITKENK